MGIIAPPKPTTPTGGAGGDLEGEYPNPTLAANTVTSTEVTEGTLTANRFLGAVRKALISEKGKAALVGGKVVIVAPALLASSVIMLAQSGTTALTGALVVTARVSGEGFTVESTLPTSTDTVEWAITTE